jgi:hypothetical protein
MSPGAAQNHLSGGIRGFNQKRIFAAGALDMMRFSPVDEIAVFRCIAIWV